MAEARRRTREVINGSKKHVQKKTHWEEDEAAAAAAEGEKRIPQQEAQSPSAKAAIKSFFACKHHHPAAAGGEKSNNSGGHHSKRIGCSGSICKLRDMQRPPAEPAAVAPRIKKQPLREINGVALSHSFSSRSSTSAAAAAAAVAASTTTAAVVFSSSSCSSSSVGGSFRRMQLRRFSGCYECQMVVDPINMLSRDSSLRSTICSCPDCGEIFVKAESLEIHQAVRHAVSELGPEDTSRNIVEIIFQSSWLKKQTPLCKIDRILKIHNTGRTLARFEDYRDTVKSKAAKLARKHPRCTADGNELLRFHCTSFACSLGLNGATNLCSSAPHCTLCSIIKNGFKADSQGRIRTMATSGRAHDAANVSSEKTAILVCRVIAGRVRRKQDEVEEYDSAAGAAGIYSNLDELFVFDPKAILPCFVVIYRS